MERSEIDPQDVPPARISSLMRALVVPRPIAWVSSRSASGVDNLAPHSFFTIASDRPPVVQFTSSGRKDTLANVEATGEFVVNLSPEPLFETINATSVDCPPELDEFALAGVERELSLRVAPPRVAASPAALECVLHATIPVGDSTLVLGRIVHVAVATAALRDDRPAIDLLRPLARLGGRQWATVGEAREVRRPRWGERA